MKAKINVDKVVRSTVARLNIIRDCARTIATSSDPKAVSYAYVTLARNVNDIVETLRTFRNDTYKIVKLKVRA